jgi:hypothetical protein
LRREVAWEEARRLDAAREAIRQLSKLVNLDLKRNFLNNIMMIDGL